MSCLFDSVSSFTKNCSSADLREMVVHYLRSDPLYWDSMKFSQVFSMFPMEDVHGCRNIQEYVHRMTSSHTWGGAIEIQSMCNLFQIGIRVHVFRPRRVTGNGDHPPITFVPAVTLDDHTDHKEPHPQVILDLLWTGNHFDPLPR